MFGMYQFVIVDKDPSDLLGGLSQSRQVTGGHKLQLLVLVVAIGGLNIVGMLGCCVGYIFTVPLSQLLMVVAYMRMTGQPTIVEAGYLPSNEQPPAATQNGDYSW